MVKMRCHPIEIPPATGSVKGRTGFWIRINPIKARFPTRTYPIIRGINAVEAQVVGQILSSVMKRQQEVQLIFTPNASPPVLNST